jgi:hypothetical protein
MPVLSQEQPALFTSVALRGCTLDPMATTRYPGDAPCRMLPDQAEITLRGSSDGELGDIVVETPHGLTHRERLLLMRRFAAHLLACADDYEAVWLRRKRRPAADHRAEGATANGL